MKHTLKISKIIFGLGNPGQSYSKNKHNVGKLFIDYLENQCQIVQRGQTKTVGDFLIIKNSKDKFVAAYQSPSYMNLSGKPLKHALKQCDISNPEDIMIAHDDLDTKQGKSKIKIGGSPEGHNGLKSIIQEIGTKNFLRLKIGVDRPVSHDPSVVAGYVLSNFDKPELEILSKQAFPQANNVLSTLEIQIDKNFIRQLYIYCFSILLLITFFLLPFSFFYSEEKSADYDIDIDFSTRSESQEKVVKALKNTVFFVLILMILLVIGLSFRPQQITSLEHGKEVEWVKQLFDVEHVGEQAINFCLAVIVSFGTLLWAVYGSYGIGTLPWTLIKGSKSLEQEKEEVQSDLANIRERYRNIQEKYVRSHTKISKIDQKALAHLRKQERLLSAKSHKIEELSDNSSKVLQKILMIISPFRFMLGVAALSCSVLIFWSLSLTSLDRIMNSKCGFFCGYMVDRKKIFNPIDSFLVYTSNFFPLDYIIFSVLVIYIFICVLYGVIKFGFSFYFFKGYEVRKGTTLPQSLIIVAFIMNISILVLSTQFITLSPQYTTFGPQKYKSTGMICSLNAIGITSNFLCNMSNISAFVNKISISFPLFAMVSFFANLCFIFLNALCFLYGLLKKRSSQIDEDEDELLYNNDEEGHNLVNYH